MSVVVHTRTGGWCHVCGGTGVLEIRHVDSEAGWSLAKRLEEAKLAGTRELRSGLEYHFRTNEMAANMALNLFAEWLRERGMDGLARQIIEGEQ